MKKFNKVENSAYGLLSHSDLEAIHEATLELMETHGVRVCGHECLEVLYSGGCTVDKASQMVKYPRALVNEAIQKCPEEFVLCGRDPKKDVTIGGDKVAFKNFGTGVQMMDLFTGEIRPSNLEDLSNVARFIDALDQVDVFSIAVTGQDIDPKVRMLHEAETVFHNMTKNFAHDLDGKENTERFIKMAAAIVGGTDKLKERPIVAMGACPNSPLEINKNETDVIMLSAKYGLPINILSMGLAGATTPVTMAGTLVTTNAEILAGIVLAQLINPGTPIIYGSSTTSMDMRFATTPVGAPEHAMFSSAVGQIGHYYGIPTNVGGT